MISLNLLPDVKKQLLRAQRERNLVIFISIVAMIGAGVLLAVMGIVMGGQIIHKSTMESSIKKNEATINKDKSEKQLDKYLTVQNQLKQIDGLKANQMLYSRMFEYAMQLNPAAPNNILIKSLTVSDGTNADDTSSEGKGSVTIDGKTASYASLNVFKETALKAKIVYTPDDGSDVADDSSSSDNAASSETSTTDSSDSTDSTDSSDSTDSTDSTDSAADSSSDSTNDSSDGSDSDTTNSNTSGNVSGASETDSSDESKSKEVKENLFSKVEITAQTLQNDSSGSTLSFTITMEYNKNAFLQTSKNVRLEVPKETTSDADQNAPKETDIFTKNDKLKQTSGEGDK